MAAVIPLGRFGLCRPKALHTRCGGFRPLAPVSSKRSSSHQACSKYLEITHPDGPPSTATAETLARLSRNVLVTYARPPLIISHGKGCLIFDSDGREYIDLTAGIAVNSLGHADDGVARTLAEQASKLVHSSNLFHNPWAGELASLLVESTKQHGGMGYSGQTADPGSAESSGLKVFLANSGSEANEGALKFARKYGKIYGGSGKKHGLVCFANGFHGRTMGSLSVTHQPKYQEPFEPLVPGVAAGVLNDINGLDQLVSEDTCGVIVEPIQGEGGIMEASEAFLRALRKRCDEVGAILIFDEIQCGLGRTGSLWAHGSFPVDCHPDIVTMAKPLANGIPIGAILVRDHVADVIKLGDHGTTFGGGALQSAVAHHVLSRLVDPSLMDHVNSVGSRLRHRLQRLPTMFPTLVSGAVRGRGLILGLPFAAEHLPSEVIRLCRERGVLLLTCGNSTVRFVPSLIVTEAQIDHACDVLESVLLVLSKASE